MLTRFEQFSSVISGISRHIQKLERDEMVKYGFKGAFAQYLVVLQRFPEGVSPSRLCELCDKDKAAVSRVLAEMSDKGLVTRGDAGERVYKAPIKLTEAGRRAAEFVSRRAQTAVEAVGSSLTDDDRRVFYTVLDTIFSNLEILAADGIPPETAGGAERKV